MTDISISLNNIRKTRSLYVEDLGVAFTVRKLGAGEELDLSDKMRRLGEILKELKGIDFAKYNTTKEEDIKELEKISKRAAKLSDEINDIQRFELATYKRCFSDDANGENVTKLLNSLTVQDRSELFNQVFDTVKPIDTPKSVEAAIDEQVTDKDIKAPEEALEEVK